MENVINKLIICESRDDTGRLYIQTLCDFIDVQKKFGWWNVFTLSDTGAVDPGYWICRINRIAYDKHDNMMYIVAPIKYLGNLKNVRENMNALYLFSKSKLFVEDAGLSAISEQYDFYKEYIVPREKYGLVRESEVAKKLLGMFMSNEMTLSEVTSEVTAERLKFYWTVAGFKSRLQKIVDEQRHYYYCYPLVYEKAQGKPLWDYVESILWAYGDLVRDGKVRKVDTYEPTSDSMDMLDMLNEVAQYYKVLNDEKKAREKAERKAKRKAKKGEK